jgi:hypothetical protein
MKLRRLGKFSIPMKRVSKFDTTVKRIMGLCIIVRAEVMYDRDAVEYVALSEHFEENPEYVVVPEYIWHVDDGHITAHKATAK